MPETEGSPAVGTADLHGSTIAIETGKGEKTTFELVRLGTLKEFETVKQALEEKARALALSISNNDSLRDQVAKALERAEESSKAYVAEKEAREDSNEERGRLHGLLESEKETSADLNGKLNADRARLTELQAELQDACQELRRRVHVENALRQAEATLVTRAQELNAKDSELEDLMSTKSSLEETNTALEVSEKELCEAKAEHERTGNALSTEKEVSAELTKANQGLAEGIQRQKDTIANLTAAFEAEESVSAQLTVERDRHAQGRDASQQAFADLKAELLKHAGCMSDVLDAMHEKLAGE